MSTIERAIAIALEAHTGGKDKAGESYILHPLTVMLTLPLSHDRSVNAEHARMAAVMHDVLEDAADTFTLEGLRAEGFPEPVLEALVALTKTEGESRESAARRAAGNPIARLVKLADVKHNMDVWRFAHPGQWNAKLLAEYRQVRDILEQSFTR